MYQKEFQNAYFVFLRFESDIKTFVLSTLERLSSGNTWALIDLCKKLAILFKSQNSIEVNSRILNKVIWKDSYKQ